MQTSRVQPCESDRNTGTVHAMECNSKRLHMTQQRCCFQSSATRLGRIRIRILPVRELPSLLQEPQGEPSVSSG